MICTATNATFYPIIYGLNATVYYAYSDPTYTNVVSYGAPDEQAVYLTTCNRSSLIYTMVGGGSAPFYCCQQPYL